MSVGPSPPSPIPVGDGLFPELRRSLSFEVQCLIPTTTHQRKRIITLRPKDRAPITSIGNTPELDEALRQWDRILAPYIPSRPLEGGLKMSVRFDFPWRETEPGKNRLDSGILCTVKPDLSNLIKTMEDRLEKLGFMENDSRIAMYGECSKWWSSHPGLALTLEEIG